MIIGIGSDIVEIKRIENAIRRTPHFIEKLFTDKEEEYFRQKGFVTETIAATFAAKEAFSKALGTGFRGFLPKDIEVLRNNLGKPYINLSEKLINKVKPIEIHQIHVTLSHCKDYAIAYVVIEGCE